MPSGSLDQAGEVRGEDAFDVAAVDAFLKARVGLSGTPGVTQFPGGASNLTYQLTYPDRELILRRPPGGHLPRSGHDMKREFTVQSKLAKDFPFVPEMVAFCDDKSVIGSDFYVMAKVPGIILRKDLPTDFTLSPEAARALSTNWVERLVDLHSVDPAAAGLSELGRGTGYVERQIEGWSKRYDAARTRNVPSFKKVKQWLRENQPEDVGNCVIHNDWRLDNVVLDPEDPSRIIAVLDWEMATLGDPLMDLGSALAYWIEPGETGMAEKFRLQPSNVPGMLTRREIVALYSEKSGIEIDDFRFYEVYGYFRLAGIIQQIYKRYSEKETTNPRFKNFWIAVWYLHGHARRSMR
ncbi:MAG: phosphotransferase family protein [Thermoleophilaceae bacterium]|nr:phosphotransferase family protein [Thermoleophilaceae bacterium]